MKHHSNKHRESEGLDSSQKEDNKIDWTSDMILFGEHTVWPDAEDQSEESGSQDHRSKKRKSKR